MAQSDARFGYRADLSRTDHDLSRKFGFTCTSGMLLPIFADVATPGETYYVTHDLDFMRTNQLYAPAMIDVKVHFETFFVPMQMMFQPFENTIFSLKNLQSTFYGSGSSLMNNSFPCFAYASFISLVTNSTNMTTDHHADAFRLADMLDLGEQNFATYTQLSTGAYKPNFFPWQLMAYHTIFNYYYRLDDKTQFDNSYCNCDSSYASSAFGGSWIGWMDIHQRPWNFDYFTSMYCSPIVANANMQNVMPTATDYNDLAHFGTAQVGDNGTGVVVNESIRGFSSSADSSYSARHNQLENATYAIRQMFANEKLAMITGRARKTYDSQVLAHFGVNVPHDVKHDLTLIGADSYPLHVGEVTSLAATSDAGLGDFAGKGWAQANDGNHKHKFTAPCHGVIMTIFSVEPIKRYHVGFGRQNSLYDAFDIPTPEYDRLGNQPVFRFELGTNAPSGSTTDIVGWKERYYWNKRRPDKITAAFMDPQSATVQYNSYASYFVAGHPFTLSNQGTGAAYSRPDLQERFYIDRHAMDLLMLTPYLSGWYDGASEGYSDENWNNNPWLAYARDPFIVDSYVKVKKISWMSKDGEPIYPY